MTYKIEAKTDVARAQIIISRAPHDVMQAVRQGFHFHGKAVYKIIRFGLLRRKRHGKVFLYKGRRLTRSAPGEEPQRVTGKLRASQDFKTHGAHLLVFRSDAEYSRKLDEGDSSVLARPFFRKKIIANQSKMNQRIRMEIDRRQKP